MKETEAPISRSVYSSDGEAVVVAGRGAAAPTKDPDTWQEFSHPRFLRGRRDLLADIKRQKDVGRHKRKQGAICVALEGAYWMFA